MTCCLWFSGYIGSVSFLDTVLQVVDKLRSVNPDLVYGNLFDLSLSVCMLALQNLIGTSSCHSLRLTRNGSFLFANCKHAAVCDPVLGDEGKLYVPQELISVYQQKVILSYMLMSYGTKL